MEAQYDVAPGEPVTGWKYGKHAGQCDTPRGRGGLQ